jgi:hypothetical protein
MSTSFYMEGVQEILTVCLNESPKKDGNFLCQVLPPKFGGLPQYFHHRHQCSKTYMCL